MMARKKVHSGGGDGGHKAMLTMGMMRLM